MRRLSGGETLPPDDADAADDADVGQKILY